MFKKNQLLDPLCTIVKLIQLNFNIDGTRIIIQNNKICIDIPHKIQSVERFINGDSRNDICILGNAINNFKHLYLYNYKENKDVYDKLCNLTKYACSGLKRLQKTYFDINNKCFDNCIFTIQFYIITLLNVINEVHYDNKYSLKSLDIPTNLLDDNKIKQVWSIDDIDELHQHFIKCFDEDCNPLPVDKDIQKNLSIIHTIISSMDEKFIGHLQRGLF